MRTLIVAGCVVVIGLLLLPGCKYLEGQGSSVASETEESRKEVSEDAGGLLDALQARVEQLEKEVKELKPKPGAEGEQ